MGTDAVGTADRLRKFSNRRSLAQSLAVSTGITVRIPSQVHKDHSVGSYQIEERVQYLQTGISNLLAAIPIWSEHVKDVIEKRAEEVDKRSRHHTAEMEAEQVVKRLEELPSLKLLVVPGDRVARNAEID
jgi:hypothetical protein